MIHGRKNKNLVMLLIGLALSVSSCSQSPSSDDPTDQELNDLGNTASTDAAGTDVVPPADPNAATDPNALATTDPAGDPTLPSDPNVAAADPNAIPAPTDPNAVVAIDPNQVAPVADSAMPAPVVTDTTTPPPAVEPTAVIADTTSTPPVDYTQATPPSEPSNTPSAPVGSTGTENYSVKSGDTLMTIAFEKYGDLYQWKRIYEMNKDSLKSASRIDVGMNLKVDSVPGVQIDRNGESYKIRSGDTLGRISSDVYGTPSKWRKIYENNRQLIKNPNKIYAGFYLYYQATPEDLQRKEELKRNQAAPLAQESAPSSMPDAAPAPNSEAPPVPVAPSRNVGSDTAQAPSAPPTTVTN